MNNIGSLNESSLHAALKQRYSRGNFETEVKLEGSIVDVFREGTIVEIQTGSFSTIKSKLIRLCREYKVLLVYPLPEKKIISVYDAEENTLLHRRKSPKKCKVPDAVRELCRIIPVLSLNSFSLELLLIEEEEIRRSDGNGSWRRKGVSIVDRKLVEVRSSLLFSRPSDYLKLLPESVPEHFTNKDIAAMCPTSCRNAQGISYCLKALGLIHVREKKGNTQVFSLT